MRNITDLLLRVRKDKMSRVKNGTDMLLRVKNELDLLLRLRDNKKSREKNDTGLLLKVG